MKKFGRFVGFLLALSLFILVIAVGIKSDDLKNVTGEIIDDIRIVTKDAHKRDSIIRTYAREMNEFRSTTIDFLSTRFVMSEETVTALVFLAALLSVFLFGVIIAIFCCC
ncbi:hypothetical protein PCE1_004365 [Barthelona sp. PCE]